MWARNVFFDWKALIFLPAFRLTCATSPFLSPPDFRQTMALAAARRRDHQRKLGNANKRTNEIEIKKISATPPSGRVNVLFVKDTTSHHHSKSAPARVSSPHSALSVALHNALRMISRIYSTAFHFSPSEPISLIPGSCHCRCAGSSSSHKLV